MQNVYILLLKHQGRRELERHGLTGIIILKWILREKSCALGPTVGFCEHGNRYGVIKDRKIRNQLNDCELFKEDPVP
jgi:hypothetical protein